jgi:hypothetical protein
MAGTGRDNVLSGVVISQCILDLDGTGNVLMNVTVRNSVVRYHGGVVQLFGVTFENCTFVLDIPFSRGKPSHPDLLLSLLNSNQEHVTLSTKPS